MMKNNAVLNLLTILLLSNGTLVFNSCSSNNVKSDKNIQTYFDSFKVTGSFALYDNATGTFVIHNLKRFKDSAYTPASTFKIVNSLIGIETGRIVDEKMIIKWDGVVRSIPDWNKDLTMAEAFKVSAVPYYQEIARRIGKDTMQLWLDSLKYGNHQIGNYIDSFWLSKTLKVTADEQLGLMKKLYFGKLPFQKRTQDIVKRVMLRESTANYQLSYKTGLGSTPNGRSLAWVVGWIEENKHPYFFVLNIEAAADADLVKIRMDLFKKIMTEQGFFEGKR